MRQDSYETREPIDLTGAHPSKAGNPNDGLYALVNLRTLDRTVALQKAPIMQIRHTLSGLTFLVFASCATPSFAADATGPQSDFVNTLAHNAFVVANDRSESPTERGRRLAMLLDANFDVPRIASFVLGHHWRRASDRERLDFTAIFRDFLIRTYADRFTGLDAGTFRVKGQREESRTSTIVYTEIGGPGAAQMAKVEWRIANRNGYRVVDLSVAGISMAMTKREEFSSYLQRHGGNLSSLIERLQSIKSAQQPR